MEKIAQKKDKHWFKDTNRLGTKELNKQTNKKYHANSKKKKKRTGVTILITDKIELKANNVPA